MGTRGDELYTLRDSLHPQLRNPRPLLYLLNYFLVRPLLPLDEFGLRVLPALFGVLAMPALYCSVAAWWEPGRRSSPPCW